VNSKIPDQFKFIDPTQFRKEFALLFKEDRKFEMYLMGDPVDLFFAILNSFHADAINSNSLKYISEKPCNPQCFSHSLFWINILEQFECQSCGATSEVLQYDYNYFIYEIYVKEILNSTEKRDYVSDYANKLFTNLKNLNVSQIILQVNLNLVNNKKSMPRKMSCPKSL
jgi:hypothetical protein